MPAVFIRVPGRPSIQLAHYEERFKEVYPEADMETKSWWLANARADWVILDIGANIGQGTILFSQLAHQGHVHAIENRPLVEALRKNLSDHATTNVSIHALPPSRHATIDGLVESLKLERLDALKISVDAFDPSELLRGAAATLARFNPRIVIESTLAHAALRQTGFEAVRWLEENGYKELLWLDDVNFARSRPGQEMAPHVRPDTSSSEVDSEDSWANPFETLRKKWSEVPSGNDVRRRSTDLMTLSDAELKRVWTESNAHDVAELGFGIRGWYHNIYGDMLVGKRVLDVGSGFGISTIEFARRGAKVTFCDIVPDNLETLKRLCGIFGIEAEFFYIDSIDSFSKVPMEFDFVTAIGSLINAPKTIIRQEVQAILPHLKVGGRWLHFAYPKRRWERDGAPPFSKWGEITDGEGTPWMEYHERSTMKYLFQPAPMRLLFDCSWHNDDFNWFDYQLMGR